VGYEIFDRSGKVAEISSGRDIKSSHREKGTRTDRAGHSSRKEEIVSRKRVPHR